MTKVYLLTSGSYSDYHVVAVFSSREAAEIVLARHASSETEIEEYELDPGEVHRRDGVFRFVVEIDLDTGTIAGTPFEAYPDPDDLTTVVEESRRLPDDSVFGKWPPYEEWLPTLKVSCWARDIEHAIKITGDKRAEYIASRGSTEPIP